MPVREAAKIVAEKTGKNEGSFRVAHQRAEKKKKEDAGDNSLAMRYAKMAVLDLEKIEISHPDRDKAFNYVIEWITKAMP